MTAARSQRPCFTHPIKGFYQTLKKKAENILYSKKIGGPGPTLKTFLLQDFLAFSCIFLMIFAGWKNSLNMSIIAGLVLGMNTSCAHNFFHQSNTWRRFYWDISLVRYLIIYWHSDKLQLIS